MALAPGDKLGAFEIIALLGAGGMGEVYRARDLRLSRDVAIKVLPSSLSNNSDRLRRFEQEARAAGALNHPNILVIYHIDLHNGAPYIVSELLEGETLRQRITHSRLSQRAAIGYASQIACGLAAAHEKGIVHRDLKPENIFLTKDGRLKILDFGLAKLTQTNDTHSQSDIPTRRLDTQPGAVIGTIGYMSPEQVRGQPLDHRTDIFAFGAILYEMLSGRRAFQGESAADTMSTILNDDPPALSNTAPNTSRALELLVNRCLEKHPEQRFHSASDLAFAVEALCGAPTASIEPATSRFSVRRLGRRELLSWSLVGLLFLGVLALAIAFIYSRRARTSEQRLTRFLVFPPTNSSFEGIADFISPDGRKLLFRVSSRDERKRQLWIRSLDSLTAQPVPGTEEAGQTFWSPDSRFLAFFGGGKLKKLELASGVIQTLADAPQPRGGTWNSEGVILFTPATDGGLFRVSAAGGSSVTVTKPDVSRGQRNHSWPRFLPDGRHFLYLSRSSGNNKSGIYVGSLDSGETKLLVNSDASAMYAPPGYLLFMQRGGLMAQTFDIEKLELSGEPFVITEEVGFQPLIGRAIFCVSNNHVLVYRSSILSNTQLTWFDRTGKNIGSVGDSDTISNSSLSHDETRIVVGLTDRSFTAADIWLLDQSGRKSRFTFDPGLEISPAWSPDGSRIAFSADRTGRFDLYWKPISGDGNEELLYQSNYNKHVSDWSADGRYILFIESTPTTGYDLWILPLFGDHKPTPFLQTQFHESQAKFSPDGHWIAYSSNESGKEQIYVRSLSGGSEQKMISIDGGTLPRWRPDGKELFYLGPDDKLMAVSVRITGNQFAAGTPESLFQAAVSTRGPSDTAYSVARDNKRFLMNIREESSTSPLVVVENWTAMLNR